LQERPCATPGCSFKATWHPTHCCVGCKDHGGACHGPKCERRQQESADVPETTQEKQAHQDAGEKLITEEKQAGDVDDVKEVSNVQRFAIPIMLDDGRQLLMEWEAGADLQQVATAWVLENGVPEEYLPQILDFAHQLTK
jgi:hypothetical protein